MGKAVYKIVNYDRASILFFKHTNMCVKTKVEEKD
jgi:hypothetical protein